MSWVLDLDGVVWLGEQAIDGAAGAIARLRASGERVLFCTNNSYETVSERERMLERLGVEATGAVVTSAQAAATLVEPAQRVLVCGGPGVREAIERRGATAVEPNVDPHAGGTVDAVVVGWHRDFDYVRMQAAATAVLQGARLIATNDDRTYPTPGGPVPGAGAITASIEYATGVRAEVAGKPHRPMVDLVRTLAGDRGVMVGDRPETDGAFARALGYQFALVLTGVTVDAAGVAPPPDLVAPSLADLVP